MRAAIMRRLKLGFVLLVLLTACAATAQAQPLVALELAGGTALGAPQSDRFGAGGAASVAAYARVLPVLLLGGRLRAGFLGDGDAPSDAGQADPGIGSHQSLSLLVRLRPLAKASEPRSAVGLFVEAGPSGTLTGELVRFSGEAGVGYGFALGSLALAPTLRYVQVLQPGDPLSSADARMLLFGAELSVFDSTTAAVEAAPSQPAVAEKDLDEDGIADANDACKDTPEDADQFQDHDGCPEPDNDGDGLADASDKCPNAAEDSDGFEDGDGCPEADNDADGFLDADDQCPAEAEVVNGNKDYDGCPDEGLIVMRDDRIVLEERVLFDFERARVKSAGRPVLDAIVSLFELHPEWVKIRIEGHADTRGDQGFNQELSHRRAENVRKELVRRGIPAEVIESIGYGSSKPRDLRQEEEAHQRNRRVEFVVVARALTPAAPGPAPKATPEPAPKAAPAPAPKAASEPAPKAAPAPAPTATSEPAPKAAPAPRPPTVNPEIGDEQ
jgi:outer membrane protein OmpA-like peptidoglycan-associated protein